MSTERPILFSGPMVRAILDGRKTQTRRIVKPQPKLCRHPEVPPFLWWKEDGLDTPHEINTRNPYGRPGDRLWVKETYRLRRFDPIHGGDFDLVAPSIVPDSTRWFEADGTAPAEFGKLRPSIFMQRSMSRITLEIDRVRVERLNDISEADAIAEGLVPALSDDHQGWLLPNGEMVLSPIDAYRALWESINGAGSWEANPWVWVIEFKRIST